MSLYAAAVLGRGTPRFARNPHPVRAVPRSVAALAVVAVGLALAACDEGKAKVTPVAPIYKWAQLAGNGQHTFALKSDGTLWAWGANFNGELGDGTLTPRPTPVPVCAVYNTTALSCVTPMSGVAKIAAGGNHGVALKTDGSLWTWGYGGNGQLGNGSTAGSTTPINVPGAWTSIAAGYSSTGAVTSDGKLYMWGDNEFGQLGNPSSGAACLFQCSTVPLLVAVPGVTWKSLAPSSGYHTLAIDSSNRLWAWGNNSIGQLGTTGSCPAPFAAPCSPTPLQVCAPGAALPCVSFLGGIASAAAGYTHSSALTTGGQVLVWGDNTSHQLGDGTLISSPVPEPLGTLSSWTALSIGYYQTLALQRDHSLWAWGGNGNGQIGDGTTVDKSPPVRVGTNSWAVLGASGYTSAAEQTDGTVWGWGFNANGEAGIGSTSPSIVLTPTPVPLP